MYILLAILVFGILIAVHELGHFLVAKACGVRVDEFAIGMGPRHLEKAEGGDALRRPLPADRRVLRHGGRGRGDRRPARVHEPAGMEAVSDPLRRCVHELCVRPAAASDRVRAGEELFHADAHGLHGRLPLSGRERPAGGRYDLEHRRTPHLFYDQCQRISRPRWRHA